MYKTFIVQIFFINLLQNPTFGTDFSLPDMPIQMKYIKAICSGAKIYESRANSEKYDEFTPGKIVRWISVEEDQPINYVTTRITERQDFMSFRQMLLANDYKSYLPDAASLEEAINIYHSFPGYQSRAELRGVISLRIEKIDTCKLTTP